MLEIALVDRPFVFPGRCLDGTQDGPVIDLCVELPMELGRAYLSMRQLRDALRVAPKSLIHQLVTERGDYVPAGEHRQIVTELEAELVEARHEIEELRSVSLAMLRRAGQELAEERSTDGTADSRSPARAA